MSSMTPEKLQNLLEAALMVYGKPMSVEKMQQLFEEDKQPSTSEIKQALSSLNDSYENRGLELKEVASGYRFQARQEYAEWIARLWEEKAPRYSRALLETLALIAYRQPITRSEIEDVRGVSVSSHIIKTLLEREWVRVVGHRDVPGRPALYATTKDFLDYFNLSSLEQLPTLSEIRDLDKINAELDLGDNSSSNTDSTEEADSAEDVETELPGGEETSEQLDNETAQDALPVDGEVVVESSEFETDSEVNEFESDDDQEQTADDAQSDLIPSVSGASETEVSMPEEFDDEDILEAIELADKANLSADESTFNDAFEPEVVSEDNDDSDLVERESESSELLDGDSHESTANESYSDERDSDESDSDENYNDNNDDNVSDGSDENQSDENQSDDESEHK